MEELSLFKDGHGSAPIISRIHAAGEDWAACPDGQLTMLRFGQSSVPKCAFRAWSFDVADADAEAAWRVLSAGLRLTGTAHPGCCGVLGVEKSPPYTSDAGGALLHHMMVFTSDWNDKVRGPC